MITFKEKQKTLFVRTKENRINITPSEAIVKDLLKKIGVKFIFQKSFIKGNYYCIVDFYLPKPYKLCIEIDGEYHNSEEQKQKDIRKDNYLVNERNFCVLRITNKEVEELNQYNLISKIYSIIKHKH